MKGQMKGQMMLATKPNDVQRPRIVRMVHFGVRRSALTTRRALQFASLHVLRGVAAAIILLALLRSHGLRMSALIFGMALPAIALTKSIVRFSTLAAGYLSHDVTIADEALL